MHTRSGEPLTLWRAIWESLCSKSFQSLCLWQMSEAILSFIKQRRSYLLYLFSFPELCTRPATGAGWALGPRGSGPPNTAVSEGKVINLPVCLTGKTRLRYGSFEFDFCSLKNCVPCWRRKDDALFTWKSFNVQRNGTLGLTNYFKEKKYL